MRQSLTRIPQFMLSLLLLFLVSALPMMAAEKSTVKLPATDSNFSRYANNNPVNFIDPSGLCPGDFDDPEASVAYLSQQADLAIDRGDYAEATFLRAFAVFIDQSGATAAQRVGSSTGGGEVFSLQNAFDGFILAGSVTGIPSLNAARKALSGSLNGLRANLGAAGSGEVGARVLQTGGNTVRSGTARGINEYLGTAFHKKDFGRALEQMKDHYGLANNSHGKILSNGDVLSKSGTFQGNLTDFIPGY